MKIRAKITSIFLLICLLFSACTFTYTDESAATKNYSSSTQLINFDFDQIPEFKGEAYVEINNNIPYFEKDDYTTTSFETYGKLDKLGRCTTCVACIGQDIMPTEKRGSIGSIKPTGWQTAKYNNIDGKYLYNRCHLIGYQLSAENANPQNLITGTRYMNTVGMLPFEDEVADYVKSTNNHVMYRVTPLFVEDELVARGVLMEAYSVEDNGTGVCFNVYCYNNQPGIVINYQTGESSAGAKADNYDDGGVKQTYIINVKTKKFHKKSCSKAQDISSENKKTYVGTRSSLTKNGYEPCKQCKP